MTNRLKELRKEKGYTLNDIARDTGIKRGTYNNYENGKTEPKLATWKKLADYFDVPIPYLQGITENADTIANYKMKHPNRVDFHPNAELVNSLINDGLQLDLSQIKQFEKGRKSDTTNILKLLIRNIENETLDIEYTEYIFYSLSLLFSLNDSDLVSNFRYLFEHLTEIYEGELEQDDIDKQTALLEALFKQILIMVSEHGLKTNTGNKKTAPKEDGSSKE